MLEKVIVQHTTDPKKKVGINTLLLEDFIYVGAIAIQFVCEPSDRMSLTMEFFFDEFTDVYHYSAVIKKGGTIR